MQATIHWLPGLLVLTMCLAQFVDRPIPLLGVDETNTRLDVMDEGLDMLKAIEGPVAVVTVVGSGKSGKSFLLNRMVNVSNDQGFGVGTSFKPGTKGVALWGRPIPATTPDGMPFSIVFMDTEGLGAPGNAVDSYDPKLCAFAVIFSSLFYYNTRSQIEQKHINLLHSVAVFSHVFESEFQTTFPFPPITWLVQSFTHDLDGLTEDDYLDWAFQEKPGAAGNEEISRFNEVIQVVKTKFPVASPRVILFPEPAPGMAGRDLAALPPHALSAPYLRRLEELMESLNASVRPKTLGGGTPVDGPGLAATLLNVVPYLNNIQSSVGPALVRQFAELLRASCFNDYTSAMGEVETPTDDGNIVGNHTVHSKAAIDAFEGNCTGGVELRENRAAEEALQKDIDATFNRTLLDNYYTAWQLCERVVREEFEAVRKGQFASYAEYEEAVAKFEQHYRDKCRGPQALLEEVFFNHSVETQSLVEQIMVQKASKDLRAQVCTTVLALIIGALLLRVVLWPLCFWGLVERCRNTLLVASKVGVLLYFLLSIPDHLMEEISARIGIPLGNVHTLLEAVARWWYSTGRTRLWEVLTFAKNVWLADVRPSLLLAVDAVGALEYAQRLQDALGFWALEAAILGAVFAGLCVAEAVWAAYSCCCGRRHVPEE